MADDPSSSFRQRFASKAPVATPPAASPALVVNRTPERAPYQAFGAKDKVVRLDVRCREGGIAHAVSYNYLLNLSYDRRHYTQLFLTVSGLTIMVKGRGLRPVVDAIKLHTCEFIQEYDPEEFSEPLDPAGPMIDSIAVEIIGAAQPPRVQAG